jgi:hypothetical protein
MIGRVIAYMLGWTLGQFGKRRADDKRERERRAAAARPYTSPFDARVRMSALAAEQLDALCEHSDPLVAAMARAIRESDRAAAAARLGATLGAMARGGTIRPPPGVSPMRAIPNPPPSACSPELERAGHDVPIVFDVDALRARAEFVAERPFKLAKLLIVDTDERLLTHDDAIEIVSLTLNGIELLRGPIPVTVLNEGAEVMGPWIFPGQRIGVALRRREREVLPAWQLCAQLRGVSPKVDDSDRGDPEKNSPSERDGKPGCW